MADQPLSAQCNGTPEGLYFSERMLWKRAEQDSDVAVMDVLRRLARLRGSRLARPCTCKTNSRGPCPLHGGVVLP